VPSAFSDLNINEELAMYRATVYETQCPFCARAVNRDAEQSKDVSVTMAVAGRANGKTFGFYAHPKCLLLILPTDLHEPFQQSLLEE
jgi:hypothetical protein